MLMIREIMYCKPGKVRALTEKFVAMSKLMEKGGMAKMRILTDVSAERYWTLIAEFEVESVDDLMKMMSGGSTDGMSAEDMKQMDEIMKGYHDLVDHGKREIYKIEY